MFGKLALLGAASLLAYTGYAGNPLAATGTATPEGRIYHYLRDDGGARPHHVYVYRVAANQIEIYQAPARCADAAFSTAWVSPRNGRASVITQGRLMPDARHEILTSLNYDGTVQALRAETASDEGMIEARVDIEETSWHLQDLDLATLSVQTIALENPQAGFTFDLPRIESGDTLLANPGRVQADFVGSETIEDASLLRFTVSGDGLGGAAGTLWLDAESQHVVRAQWGEGRGEYRLRLAGTQDTGEAGWTALLSRHFEGCATA